LNDGSPADYWEVIDLDEMAQAASRLEPLPTSSTRLAALVCSGTPELGQVVEIVQFDEALTVSLLRSANSSWSSSRSEIKTVRDAVIRLGASPVLALTLGMNVRRHLGDAVPQYGLSEGELWRHSVASSLGAELLAPRAAQRPPPETATAALLHDVGKLVMARFLDRALLEQLQEHQERGATRIDAEAEVLGIDHAELGALIARSWALPETLVRGIREHARPRPGSDGLVHAVYLADAMAKAVGAGPDDNADEVALVQAVSELGLSFADVAELQGLVGERLAEVEQRFD
jgi:putative nucleotidyltransferase with HDIG domain